MSTPSLARTTDAIAYIEEHLTEKLALHQIATVVHCSPYHLHRTFSQTVGVTLHDYLRRRQLTEAARQLAFSHRPVIEVALLAGYESQQTFTRAFKNLYRVSPGWFRKHGRFYPLQLPFVFEQGALTLSKKDFFTRGKGTRATERDIPAWLDLARLVVDGYPMFDEDEYVDALRRAIARGQGTVVKDGEVVVGTMLFTPETSTIDYLAVHPLYRRVGLTEDLIAQAWGLSFPQIRELYLTTYRKGDPADLGHRQAFLELGFREDRLLTEFGYPTQRLVLRRH